MKELSIEEKAKHYDEASERAKLSRLQLLDIGEEATEIEHIFPELKESEDDVMRKMAIKAVYAPEAQSCIKSWGINPDDVIAWLEKQGEQKNEERKSKFKVGDWIVYNFPNHCANSLMLVRDVRFYGYLCSDPDGQMFYGRSYIDRNYHLWDIQDAKDGDVLANEVVTFIKNSK